MPDIVKVDVVWLSGKEKCECSRVVWESSEWEKERKERGWGIYKTEEGQPWRGSTSLFTII